MSLRRRLTLLSALAVAVAVALASVIVYAVVRGQLRGQIDDTLRERAGAAQILPIRNQQVPPPRGGAPVPFTVPVPNGGTQQGGAPVPGGAAVQPGAGTPGGGTIALPPPPGGDFVPTGQLVDSSGKVTVIRGGERLPVTDATREVAAGRRGPFFSDVSAGGSDLRVYTVPSGPGTALQVARPLDEVNQTLGDLRLTLVLVTLGGMALAAGLGLLVARGALAPAVAVSGAAEEVARTRDLTRRIEVRGDDELGRMAASFNQMMEALEASESARRQLVTDASHELRTPLATLRTNIETLARKPDLDAGERGRIVSDLEAELEDLSGLVGDVVDLAREAEEPTIEQAEVRLDEIAAATVERARRRARELSFETELEPWLVRGDPGRLDRAIWNLLDNAIKWSPPGGAVAVRLVRGTIAVSDQGPGFGPEDLEHAFDRFYRSDEARGKPGSGLGLAIALRIAEQHWGSARVANGTDGGARVELELPGEPPPAADSV